MYSTQKPAAAARLAADEAAQPVDPRPRRKIQPPGAVMDAIGARMHTAKRSARKKLFAAEDLLDMVVIQLRRRPFQSLGAALAAGVAIGIVAGRVAFTRPRRDDREATSGSAPDRTKGAWQ
jgi:hypothetical protein